MNRDCSTIQAYDRVQTEYVGERAKETWSQRLAAQFGQEPNQAIDQLFKEKKLENRTEFGSVPKNERGKHGPHQLLPLSVGS